MTFYIHDFLNLIRLQVLVSIRTTHVHGPSTRMVCMDRCISRAAANLHTKCLQLAGLFYCATAVELTR